MKKIKWYDELPPCDYGQDCPPAIYDAPTHQGPWANLCAGHMALHGIRGPAFERVLVTDA